jgi:hypothetical protein
MALLVTLAASAGPGACARHRAAPEPAYAAEIAAWQKERVASLKSEDGWLTLVSLSWLRPGENRFGSHPHNEIVLPGREVPAFAGTLTLGPDGTVTVRSLPEAGVTCAGRPVRTAVLRTDRQGRPDVLQIGHLRGHVIERAGALALRVRDPEAATRREFKGIPTFPVDPAYRVVGRLRRYREPREATVASAHGPAQRMPVPGIVEFALAGRQFALEPFVSGPGERHLFFVFRDATAGVESYGAGRFLDADAPGAGGTDVVLDFNKAYNPPCAFTPFATCPLPSAQNTLSVRIEAGEKAPRAGH